MAWERLHQSCQELPSQIDRQAKTLERRLLTLALCLHSIGTSSLRDHKSSSGASSSSATPSTSSSTRRAATPSGAPCCRTSASSGGSHPPLYPRDDHLGASDTHATPRTVVKNRPIVFEKLDVVRVTSCVEKLPSMSVQRAASADLWLSMAVQCFAVTDLWLLYQTHSQSGPSVVLLAALAVSPNRFRRQSPGRRSAAPIPGSSRTGWVG